MRRFAPLLALVPLAIPLLTQLACAPATLQTARTNGAGNFQFAVEPGVAGAAGGGGAGFIPALNLSGRYGVSDRVDLGIRLGTSAYELQGKFMLSDPTATDSVAISIAPSTMLFAFGASGGGTSASVFYWDTRVPLLFGIPVGESEFTVGPRLRPVIVGGGGTTATGSGASAGGFGLMVGGTVGFGAKLGDKFWLIPGLDIDVPVLGAATATGAGASADVGIGGVTFAAGLGIAFGGPGPR